MDTRTLRSVLSFLAPRDAAAVSRSSKGWNSSIQEHFQRLLEVKADSPQKHFIEHPEDRVKMYYSDTAWRRHACGRGWSTLMSALPNNMRSDMRTQLANAWHHPVLSTEDSLMWIFFVVPSLALQVISLRILLRESKFCTIRFRN